MSKMDEWKQALHKKAWEVRHEAEWRFQQAKELVSDNKDAIIAVIPIVSAVIGGTMKVAKSMTVRGNLRKEQQLKDLYIYDRSLGSYWKLRRKPSQAEQLEISRRKQSGEIYADILSDMNLLG